MIGSGKRRERAVLSHSASLPFSVHVFVIKERSDPNESNNVIAMSAQEMAKPGIFFILRFYPSLVTLTTPSPTKNLKKNKNVGSASRAAHPEPSFEFSLFLFPLNCTE